MENIARRVLITGASSGIGAALALHYAAQGASLVLGGRDPDRLESVRRACAAHAVHVRAVLCDVTNRAAMAAWVTREESESPLDLVIANAGISGGTGDVGGGLCLEPASQVRRIFDVNLMGVLNTIEPALPAMISRQRGQVALMGSLAGFRGFPGAPAYCASKAAIRVYGESLRGSLAREGVGVSVIMPGFIQTPMTAVNTFRMPFLTTPESAARKIASGLSRNHGRIAFPWPMAFGAWLAATLPDSLMQIVLKGTPEKKARSSKN